MAYMRERQSKWDRRHLVTVSTHLNDRDYDLLKAACRADCTTPYKLVRDFLQGYMCALCGDSRRLQIHHYVSRGRGGCNHPMNLITLCPYCHAVIHGATDPYADYMDAEELHQACAEYLGDLYANLGQVWYPYDG